MYSAASGRLKLLSAVSFGVISGVCLLIGFYLFRKRRKTSDFETISDSAILIDDQHDSVTASTAERNSDSTFPDVHSQQEKLQPTTHSEICIAEAGGGLAHSKNKDEKNDDAEDVTRSQKHCENKLFAGKTENTGLGSDDAVVHQSSASEKEEKQETTTKVKITEAALEIPEPVSIYVSGNSTDGQGSAKVPLKNENEVKESVQSSPNLKNTSKSVKCAKDGGNDGADLAENVTDSERIQLRSSKTLRLQNDAPEKTKSREKCGVDQSEDAESVNSQVTSCSNHSGQDERTETKSNAKEIDSDESSTLITRSTRSLLPSPQPLTPPPDSKPSRRKPRERGGGSGAGTGVEGEGQTNTRQAGSHGKERLKSRWPPVEDKTVDTIEVDTNSLQASWKINKMNDFQIGGHQSPWSLPDAPTVKDQSFSLQKIEFDDNFVSKNDIATKLVEQKKPELRNDRGVTKESSLLSAASQCVLEREPLISDDENEADDNDRDSLVDEPVTTSRTATKSPNSRKEETTVTAVAPAASRITAAEAVTSQQGEDEMKLIEIDENCVGSLIKMARGDVDASVRLASVRALVNLSWTTEKHMEYAPLIDQLFSNLDTYDKNLQLESLRVLANLSRNPGMVPRLLAAKAPGCLLKLLVPETDEELMIVWLTILDDVLWTSKEMCLTYASLPMDFRAASPETVYTSLYGLKNSRILKSRIFVLSRHKSQQVTYLASRIYSCLTS